MLSAGLLGGPGIGFKQDYNATYKLQQSSKDVYEKYKAEGPNSFLGYTVVGLDGAKVGVLNDEGKELARANEILKTAGKPEEKLAGWWDTAKTTADGDKKLVNEAVLYGGRQALKLTSFVPLVMAGLYLLLILYFRATGGYKAVQLAAGGPDEVYGGSEH